MSLTDLINNSRKGTVSDDQGAWRQFVLDHLDYIALRSGVYNIDAPLMNLYRYDLARFLKDRLMRHQDIGWIVQLLNSFANDFDFFEPGNIIVPTDEIITDLYHSYISINSNVR